MPPRPLTRAARFSRYLAKQLRRLSPRQRARAARALRSRASYRLMRGERRQISVLMAQLVGRQNLGVFERRMREHFSELRGQGVGRKEIGRTVVRELQEMQELAGALGKGPAEMAELLQHNKIGRVLQGLKQEHEKMKTMQAAGKAG